MKRSQPQLIHVLEKKRGSPSLAAELVGVLRASKGARAIIRRHWSTPEQRPNVVLRAPCFDEPAPETSVKVATFLVPRRRMNARGSKDAATAVGNAVVAGDDTFTATAKTEEPGVVEKVADWFGQTAKGYATGAINTVLDTATMSNRPINAGLSAIDVDYSRAAASPAIERSSTSKLRSPKRAATCGPASSIFASRWASPSRRRASTNTRSGRSIW